MKKESKRAFTASDGMKNEYCAKIVRIGEMKPIEGADNLLQTMMDGFSCVVAKGVFTPGEPVIYCLNETAVNKRFLALNNQFELGEYRLNSNVNEVSELIAENRKDEAKRKVGFFDKHGRVRMIRLRGCPSYGCIFKLDALVKWHPSLANEDLESYFTVDENGYEHPFNFDTVEGELFAEAYIPHDWNRGRKGRNRKLKQKKGLFDRMVPGQFAFHYDTNQLRDNMWRFKPETMVNISVKMHGTSVIVGKLLTRIPKRLSPVMSGLRRKTAKEIKNVQKTATRYRWQERVKQHRLQHLADSMPIDYRLGYGPVYASRTVIKNQFVAGNAGPGFYGVDLWIEYGEMLYPYLPEGMTLYGEICGYVTGTSLLIQKQYDYGCHPGDNYLMPYRITTIEADGAHREWNLSEVCQWTRQLLADHPELAPRVKLIPVLYEGPFGALYPDLDIATHWNENVLERLAADSERFGMELPEPLCRNKVPREGLVLRIVDDPASEAFKLKTNAFFERESKLIDRGEVDIELENSHPDTP